MVLMLSISLTQASVPIAAFARELRVGITGSEPFVIRDGGRYEGISLDIWKEIAEIESLQYKIISQPNPKASLESIARGQLDVAIGPISITPKRLKDTKIDFTQPYFISHVGILTKEENPSLWSRIKPFFGVAALSSVVVLFFSLLIVGNLIWLAERHRNTQQFPAQYLRGVSNGMWFALVTLTTVGYGDRAPVTPLGRWIAGVWMIVTLIAVSSITAGLASAFTISLARIKAEGFTDAADVRGASMAVVTGTTSVRLGDDYKARTKSAANLDEAIALLKEGQVEGVIFDTPALQYYLQQNPDGGLKMAPLLLATEPYGIALSEDDPLRKVLDVAVVELQRQGRTKEIKERWIDADNQRASP